MSGNRAGSATTQGDGDAPGDASTLARFLVVDSTRVRVREVGNGRPLMLIAGIGGNLDMWEPLLKELPARRLVMFDVPGTGGSDALRTAPFMVNYAAFTNRLIAALGYDEIDVLGHSWGGMLAQHLAIQHPKTVRRLVLVGTAPGLGGVPPSPRILTRMLTPRRYYSRAYLRRIAPDLYGGEYRRDPNLIEKDMYKRMGRPPSFHGYASQLFAVAGYSTLPALWMIKAPTLVLGGDDDPIIAEENPRMLDRFLKDSELRIFDGGGHMLPMDSASLVGPLISEFLDRP